VAPVATIISFRLGGNDGVAVEARKWAGALDALGFEVRRVAGEIDGPAGTDDQVIPGLAIDPSTTVPDVDAVRAAIDGSDLVVAENICSLPVHLDASRAVAAALKRHPGRVVLHHHDLPWQRAALREHEATLPPRIEGALHVTINHRSRRELEARGFEGATTIHNRFDLDSEPPTERRAPVRAALGFDADDLVLLQPARAIERKNVPGGVRFAGALQKLLPERRVRYWLSGPAEDGYAATLARVLERSAVPTTVGRVDTAAEAYSSSDVVLFPSTWEGFGNPTIETIAARRPLVVFPYPVLGEITAYGLRYFSVDDAGELARFVRAPDPVRFDANLRRARASFSLADLPAAIETAFVAHGWRSW
jgi:glycosyltransferase involved in cell wall biosynthesis